MTDFRSTTSTDLDMRELALSDALQHLQLLLAQLDVLIVQLIVDGAPELGVIVASQQAVQVAFALALGDLATRPVIADVLLVVVPVQGYVANCSSWESALLLQRLLQRVACSVAGFGGYELLGAGLRVVLD